MYWHEMGQTVECIDILVILLNFDLVITIIEWKNLKDLKSFIGIF